MKYSDIENIWDVDVGALSNADRGRLFFERAKQTVEEALDDPKERALAVDGVRFRRDYLVVKIGSGPAVTTQNPKIKDLLAATDAQLADEAGGNVASKTVRTPGHQSPEIAELKATIDSLRRRLEIKTAEAADLRRQLRETGWTETDLADHGRLPW